MPYIFMRSLICLAVCGISAGGWNLELAAQDNPSPSQQNGPDFEQLEEDAIRAAVERIRPALVRFETIGGNRRVSQTLVEAGPSTGLIVSREGFVISAAFNFAHEPTSIVAKLDGGIRKLATVVGRDLNRNLVLLKLELDEPLNLEIPVPAAPATVQVGQTVIAVGRVFDEREPNVSTGIVSAKNRIWGKALQTDAKVSPANFGGPLLDLSGRWIGLLAPLSPDDDSVLGGTEWYDSGIGFAVHATDILNRLETLKAGVTIRPGLMGLTLKGNDSYADPALIGVCQVGSPADKAGLKPGDLIVEINGLAVQRQAEMKHAIAPLDAGMTAQLVAVRNGARVEVAVELAETIEPFDFAGLGMIVRQGNELGAAAKGSAGDLAVIEVFQDGPAAVADLRPGDVIQAIEQQPVELIEDLRLQIVSLKLDEPVLISVQRAGRVISLTAKPRRLAQCGAALREQVANVGPPADDVNSAVLVEVSVADRPNHCWALVPSSLLASRATTLTVQGSQPVDNGATSPMPVLVWFSVPGPLNREQVNKEWESAVASQQAIVLFPESVDETEWGREDFEFAPAAIEALGKSFSIDRNRIAVGGRGAGAAMAGVAAFGERDLFRGLVLVDSPLSKRVTSMETSPAQPLLVLSVQSSAEIGDPSDTLNQRKIAESLDALEIAKFPVERLGLQPGEDWSAAIGTVLFWVNRVDRL